MSRRITLRSTTSASTTMKASGLAACSTCTQWAEALRSSAERRRTWRGCGVAPVLQEPLDAHVGVVALAGPRGLRPGILVVAHVVAPALQQPHGPARVLDVHGLVRVAVVDEDRHVQEPVGHAPRSSASRCRKRSTG